MASTKYRQPRHYGMYIIFGTLALLSCLSPKAQTYIPGMFNSISLGVWSPLPDYNQIGANPANQKWFFSRYAAISTGFAFYPGVSALFLSAPIGLQLNRPLNNNLNAFASIYAAPTFSSFNYSFMNSSFNKSYPGSLSNQYSFGINPGIQMGLMYVNDARTFSISGSIGVQASSYPAYPVFRSNQRK